MATVTSISNGVSSAVSSATEIANTTAQSASPLKEWGGKFLEGVNKFLDGVISFPVSHWAFITGMAVSTGQRKFGKENKSFPLTNTIVKYTVPSSIASAMNKIYENMIDPNIEGIPISTPRIDVSRDVDISECQTIVQTTGVREYRVDNATPHLRVWSIDGYLTSILTSDNMLMIKPSVILQMALLDAYAKSRKPVWFKTNNCEFVCVQIGNIKMEQTAEAANAVHVTCSLTEYSPLVIRKGLTKEIADLTKTNIEESDVVQGA